MKTRNEAEHPAVALRRENVRRAALVSAVAAQGPSAVAAGEGGTPLDPDLAHWEEVRGRFIGRIRLEWGTESAAVLAAAAAHRGYWRPARVRLLVLSESHVWTRDSEAEAAVPLEQFGHPGAPRPFVRMVYCLGYGERSLVQASLRSNFGSPQFWKLLAEAVDASAVASVVERTEPRFLVRIAAKLRLLEALRARGVWLADACPVALYAASQPKPKMRVLAEALEIAWDAYARAMIREAAPEAVMIVGKMVHDGIGDRIRALLGPSVPVEWMYQPQARRPAAEHAAGIDRLRRLVDRARASDD